MTIDLSLVISILSVITAITVALSNTKSKNKDESQKEASSLTAIIVKLENIDSKVTEIKTEMNNLKTNYENLKERIVIQEQGSKAMWKKIDVLESMMQSIIEKLNTK